MAKKDNNNSTIRKGCMLFAILSILFTVFLIDLKLAILQSNKRKGSVISVQSSSLPFPNSKMDANLREENREPKPKIAYAITVTKDGPFIDGALVLGYAAKKVHDASKGFNSKYEAVLVAFVTKTVTSARPILEKFGWRVLEKPLPVSIDEIKNKNYADQVELILTINPHGSSKQTCR